MRFFVFYSRQDFLFSLHCTSVGEEGGRAGCCAMSCLGVDLIYRSVCKRWGFKHIWSCRTAAIFAVFPKRIVNPFGILKHNKANNFTRRTMALYFVVPPCIVKGSVLNLVIMWAEQSRRVYFVFVTHTLRHGEILSPRISALEVVIRAQSQTWLSREG